MRPTLFRLASDTEDNDEALGKAYSLKGKNCIYTNGDKFIFCNIDPCIDLNLIED